MTDEKLKVSPEELAGCTSFLHQEVQKRADVSLWQIPAATMWKAICVRLILKSSSNICISYRLILSILFFHQDHQHLVSEQAPAPPLS